MRPRASGKDCFFGRTRGEGIKRKAACLAGDSHGRSLDAGHSGRNIGHSQRTQFRPSRNRCGCEVASWPVYKKPKASTRLSCRPPSLTRERTAILRRSKLQRPAKVGRCNGRISPSKLKWPHAIAIGEILKNGFRYERLGAHCRMLLQTLMHRGNSIGMRASCKGHRVSLQAQ